MEVTRRSVRNTLTRTTGFLKTETSHSAQPYQGCSFGMLRTSLPALMAFLGPESATLRDREAVVAGAPHDFPGRVGVNIDGFAGRYLPP